MCSIAVAVTWASHIYAHSHLSRLRVTSCLMSSTAARERLQISHPSKRPTGQTHFGEVRSPQRGTLGYHVTTLPLYE